MVSDYSKYKTVLIEKKDKIALITMNNPESMNPVSREMHAELEELLEQLDKDDEVNVIVLTGAGKAFSAGGDLKGMKLRTQIPQPVQGNIASAFHLMWILSNLEKPIIAACNGHAVGLGATIALFCDVVFISERARIGDPHVGAGLVAGDGGAVIWPLLVGLSRAKQYLMTGDLMTAAEAERIGLVNKVFPPDQVLPEAMAFAKRLADGPIRAISWSKQSCNLILKQYVNLVLPASLAWETLSMHSKDHVEAVDSLLEKRPAKFTGQ